MTASYPSPFCLAAPLADQAQHRTPLPVGGVARSRRRVSRARALTAFCLLALTGCVAEHHTPKGADSSPPGPTVPALSATSLAPTQAQSPAVALLYPPKPFVWLGVELKARDPGQPGVLVERVVPGSPAEQAHLQAGDVVLYLNRQPLNTPEEVSTVVRDQSAGTSTPLIIQRNGEQRLVRIQFQLMPEFEDRLRLAFIGRPAPEISGVVAFQGEVASLRQLKGQVVVLEFWASFCQACRLLGPTLDEWHRSYLSRGAQVVGITVDLPHVGLEVARRAQMGYPLGSDPDAEITRSYMASQIPTLFIIDSRGIVRDAIVGYSEQRLSGARSLIERLLSEAS